jgi:hypothetical protein
VQLINQSINKKKKKKKEKTEKKNGKNPPEKREGNPNFRLRMPAPEGTRYILYYYYSSSTISHDR